MGASEDSTAEALSRALEETVGRAPESTMKPSLPGDTAGLDALRSFAEYTTAGARRLTTDVQIGEGGMGRVLLGTQLTLGRRVAVKSLKLDKATPEAALAMLREAWVTGALQHPNVVPVYELDVDAEGRPIIVLRRIEGHSWRATMRDPELLRRYSERSDVLESHLKVLIEISQAVEYAHEQNIVHRDLKPENVMLGRFGEVYVLDWGIAVSVGPEDGGRMPRSGESPVGTPAYMAPELLGGRSAEVGTATDVYLLGACLYEVLTGEPPHRADTPLQTLGSVMRSQPEFPEGTPEALAQVCRRAMAARPEDRYPGVGALPRRAAGLPRTPRVRPAGRAGRCTGGRIGGGHRGGRSTHRGLRALRPL